MNFIALRIKLHQAWPTPQLQTQWGAEMAVLQNGPPPKVRKCWNSILYRKQKLLNYISTPQNILEFNFDVIWVCLANFNSIRGYNVRSLLAKEVNLFWQKRLSSFAKKKNIF